MNRDYYDDDLNIAKCTKCGNQCYEKVFDHGFDHEWGGVPQYEKVLVVLSHCCEAETVELEDEETIEEEE